jgi:L-alanine-DL-glutamate epimerase-like enolase superfamily enzyme
MKFISEIDKYDINVELIEQPVNRHDIKSMKNITQSSHIPILADESVFSVYDAERLIEEQACNMLNIKLAKTGGILEASKIKTLADNISMPCMIGCMMESPLGISAAASFALSENIIMADLDVLDWVSKDIYSEYIDFEVPNITLRKDALGFGFSTN